MAFGECNGEDGGELNFVPNPKYNGPKPASADACSGSYALTTPLA